MLLRYARSQFLDPNAGSENWESEVADTKDFYENDSDHVSGLLSFLAKTVTYKFFIFHSVLYFDVDCHL